MKNEQRLTNSIGMFDLLKGTGILLVIWGHTNGSLMSRLSPVPYTIAAILSVAAIGSFMPAFFIISGYSLRKRPVKKYLEQQKKLIIKPYCITAAITVALIFLRGLILRDACERIIKETLKAALAFLLAISPAGLRYFRLQNSTCGPLWFLIALLIGSAILLWMLNHVDERNHIRVVFAVSLIWCLITNWEDWVPFSLFRGLYAFFNLYIGYRIKKEKILSKSLPAYHWFLGLLVFSLMVLTAFWGGSDLLSAAVVCCYGGSYIAFLLIYLFVRLDNGDCWIKNLVRFIGKNSLLFFCVHTVENMVLPWWKLMLYFENHPLLGIIVLSAAKVLICWTFSWLILNRENLLKRIRKMDT